MGATKKLCVCEGSGNYVWLAIRMLTEIDLHQSLVAEVESRRCSQVDNIL